MRLSQKFFAITYCIVLLFCGIGGSVLVHYASSLLYQNREASLKQTSTYVLESFLSLADLGSGLYDQTELDQMTRQISQEMGNASCQIQIRPYDETENLHLGLGYLDYQPAQSMMYSLSRVEVSNQNYLIQVRMDLKDIERQTHLLWYVYMLMVLVMALTSGLVLNRVANRLAKPINQLSLGAKQIAKGQYGKQVLIQSHDQELQQLADSFNHMSLMVEKNIQKVTRQANQRDLFVANFTHEMKTPMTSIIGYARMLDIYDLDSEEGHQAAKAIYHEAKRLENLSQQLLNLYLYQNENFEMQTLSLRTLEEQLRISLDPLSAKYNVAYQCTFAEGTIIGNMPLLLSLLCNLADNAMKASQPGQVILLSSEKRDDMMRFYVKDEGRGIQPEHLPYLTEAFYREDKARSRNQGGAGLGLTLCEDICRIHGTTLTFESEVGQGTLVYFDLKGGFAK